ncbi:MAG TPA: hypothetical protein VFU35_15655 [Jatrophihabitans sp.]|nr:hypothetical protein [Jatrophihabitans sp.]
MNVLTELWLDYPLGEYSGSRAFSAERIDTAVRGLQDRGFVEGEKLTELGRAQRELIEQATDAAQATFLAALRPELPDLIASAATVSAAVVASHAAPADPRKRAAG